ncbi:outer membrane protein [Desulfonatronum parangueonense]
MKKVIIAVFLAVLLSASTSVAQPRLEGFALGQSNAAFKVDWISFQDSVFDVDLSDGVYLGVEAYHQIFPNLYLGGEIGWARATNDRIVSLDGVNIHTIDTRVHFVPLELNLKYAAEVVPNVVLGFGGGLSYSWLDLDVDIGGRSADVSEDWVFGAQLFADVNYRFTPNLFAGVNVKYQWTEDMNVHLSGTNFRSDVDMNNFRLGVQVGYMF